MVLNVPYILRFCGTHFIIFKAVKNSRAFTSSAIKAIKMLWKSLYFCMFLVILGTASADPIRRSITIRNDMLTSLLSDFAEQLELSIRPETIRSMRNFIKSAIGLKLSALEIAVKIIHWLTSNFIGIAIGGIIALGICKLTGKCSLKYDHAFSKLYSAITSEQLDMAQNLLISALRRFGEEDKEEYDNETIENEEEEDGENYE